MNVTRAATALLLLSFTMQAHAGCFPIPIPPFFACVLDREGTGSAEPDYFTCHKNFDLVKAGGKPFFKIELRGFCGVHPGGGLPGWTPVDWKNATVLAEYNYDTKVTKEQVWEGNKVMLESNLTCLSNPWAHTPSCTAQKDLVNNTGVQYNGPTPVSAWRIAHELRQSLAKWEITPSNEELLADWNPYPASTPAGMNIVSPGAYEEIPENAASFQLAVDLEPGTTTPQNLQIEWLKIIPAPAVVGDIALPADATHWWEPFSGPAFAQWSSLPLTVPVNPGYFENKPGLYEVKVRNAATGGWSPPARFWVGNATFDPPPEPQQMQAQSAKKFGIKGLYGSGARAKETDAQRAQRIAHLLATPQPRLKVTKVTWDEEKARPGRSLTLQVTVKNEGGVESRAYRHRLHVACVPAEDCPVSRPITIPGAIKPGDSLTFTAPGAVQPKHGHTRFFVSTEPVSLARDLNRIRRWP